jgi:hypothetical protein
MGGGGGSGGGTTPPGTPGASVPIAGVQWISNGQPTGGSGAYAPYAQSVQYIHDNYAHDGDAILIPGGNYTWNAQVNITKAVIVQAQIMPQDVTQPGGNGNVFITHGGQSPFLFNFTLSPNGHQTLGGINFLPGTATQCYVQMGGQFTAPQTYVQRMYQCTFNIPNFQLSTPVQWFTNGGVIWKCHWFGSSSNSNNSGNGWGSGSGGIVLKSGIPWSNRQTFGTADAGGTSNTYIEDSMFSNLYNQGIDIDDNGRLVLRNSTLNNTQGLTHGVTSLYGGSMIEMYNCTLNYFACLGNAGSVYGTFAKSVGDGQTPSDGGRWPNQSRWFWWRGGTARIHDNTITQINNYGFWGGGLAWQFTNEDMTRPGSGSSNNTENNTAYNDTYGGGWHWCGSSGKTVGGTGSEMTPWNNYSAWQVKNPIYLWNDTFVGLNPLPESSNWSTADQTGYGHDPVTGVNTTADVFLLNRNLFLSAPPAGAGTVPGAYAPYTYPHPLRNV